MQFEVHNDEDVCVYIYITIMEEKRGLTRGSKSLKHEIICMSSLATSDSKTPIIYGEKAELLIYCAAGLIGNPETSCSFSIFLFLL